MGAERMQAAFRNARLRRAGAYRAARARPSALAERLGPRDGHDLRLRPRHRGDAAPPRQRLCRTGQWRHLAAGDPAAGSRPASRAGPPGLFSERPATGCASCCAWSSCAAPAATPNAPGFRVGGKTGTAEKVSAAGGYNRLGNVSTFAAAFPMDAPRYVVLVMIDAPRPTADTSGQTTAAWTAAPVVARRDPAHRPAARHHSRLSRDIRPAT